MLKRYLNVKDRARLSEELKCYIFTMSGYFYEVLTVSSSSERSCCTGPNFVKIHASIDPLFSHSSRLQFANNGTNRHGFSLVCRRSCIASLLLFASTRCKISGILTVSGVTSSAKRRVVTSRKGLEGEEERAPCTPFSLLSYFRDYAKPVSLIYTKSREFTATNEETTRMTTMTPVAELSSRSPAIFSFLSRLSTVSLAFRF